MLYLSYIFISPAEGGMQAEVRFIVYKLKEFKTNKQRS